ncbi:MAG: response regulator [Deltaproteobacteria bacterium]|nr:response regulator [Deltaproteobacteria bacterium]
MDERIRSIWPVFAEEARESVQSLGDGLLALERTPLAEARETVIVLKRTAHSLKGSAGSMGFGDVENLAHALEDAIAHAPEHERLSASIVEAALAAIASIEAMVDAVDRGGSANIPRAEELASALRGGAPVGSQPAKAPQARPATQAAPALSELWPTFHAEMDERLKSLRSQLAELPAKLGADQVDPLRPLAESLQRSAATLQHAGLTARAGAVLAALKPGAKAALVKAAEALAGALEAEANLRKPAAAAPSPALAEVDALEAGFGAVRGASANQRAEVAQKSADRVQQFVRWARGQGREDLASIAARLHETYAGLGGGQLTPGRALAQAAEALVELRARAQKATDTDQGESISTTARAERMVRVATSKIDGLAGQVEQWSLVQQRQEWRTVELRRLLARTWASAAAPQRVATLLRAGETQAAAEETNHLSDGLRALHRDLARLAQELIADGEAMRMSALAAREDLRDLRTVPASVMLEPLPRAVRDVSGRLGKQVELSLVGDDVRLDRRMVEELKDPLMHLVRNAIDHGLESPEARRAAGKSEVGRLEIRVEPRGRRVALLIKDDGAGLDVARIRAVAKAKGVLDAAELAKLDDHEAVRLIFRPGFSTAAEVTNISGRGVGLDVVHAAVVKLGGAVNLSFRAGRGTTFELDLPLTLASALGVLVRAGSEVLAFPAESITQILKVAPNEVSSVAGRASVVHEGRALPYLPLARALGQVASNESRTRWVPGLLLASGTSRAVVAVDEVLGEQELVVQGLGKVMANVKLVAGASMLNDGRVVTVANAAELLRQAAEAGAQATERARILVADDALTTRALMRSVLELAGYEVAIAPDGEAAFELLQKGKFDLVVSDVQMPRLDGLGLCRRIRADQKLRETPLILVTSLDAQEDKAAGLSAGANGYLVKREVERGKLLELVGQLLPRSA